MMSAAISIIHYEYERFPFRLLKNRFYNIFFVVAAKRKNAR